MITFLIGTVDSTTATSVCLNVQSVGYEILCASGTLNKCNNGSEIKLYIHHHITENNQALYGFWDKEEREFFRLLTSVNGVGPKVGLGILSTLSPKDVADAVATQSGKMMARAQGVGPKLGERIVMELKGKLGALPTSANGANIVGSVGGIGADVLSALVNLGYKEVVAQQAVSATMEKIPTANFDEMLKSTLQILR